ncbi:unnamed protein product, partial [Phaeothamnion confervicola]
GLLLLRQTLVREHPPPAKRDLLVYAARPPGAKRGVLNEAEVIAALEKAAVAAGLRLRVFRGEEEGIAGAVAAFSRAKAIVGVHGAALANAVFAPAGAALFEVRMPEPALAGIFAHLGAVMGLDYHSAGILPPNHFESPV